jgi:hypothetical protein
MGADRPGIGRRARAALRRNRTARTAAALYRHRACGPDDVILASYPKSGNTWLKFLLADILTDADTDFERSERAIPLLGSAATGAAPLPGGGHLWKSHEPYSPLFKRRCTRAIYLVRDARDVAISEYHFLQRKGRFTGELDRFLEVFLAGSADGYGSWDAHVTSWIDGWRGGPQDRITVRYEDMLADCAGTLAAVLRFLDVDASPERVALAVDRNSFANMRAKEAVTAGASPQVRAGRAGQWQTGFTAGQRARFFTAMPQLARMGYEE